MVSIERASCRQEFQMNHMGFNRRFLLLLVQHLVLIYASIGVLKKTFSKHCILISFIPIYGNHSIAQILQHAHYIHFRISSIQVGEINWQTKAFLFAPSAVI